MIREWIAQGAPWKKHWAYEVPRRAPIPTSPQLELVGSNWIDRFVAEKHRKSGARFSPPADKTTLLRRLSFDLTGLPPSVEAVHDFLHDESPAAVEKVVDRLLSSSAYGERMAAYWLDLVRFADTVGTTETRITTFRHTAIMSLTP